MKLTDQDETPLLRRFASAPFGFFGLKNYELARHEFLKGHSVNPVFAPNDHLNVSYMQQRKRTLEEARAGLASEQDGSRRAFINWRLRETEYMLTLIRLREQPNDAVLYKQFRQLVTELYGQFDPEVFAGVIGYLHDKAAGDRNELFREIQERLSGFEPHELFKPSKHTFMHYRTALLTSDHLFNNILHYQLPVVINQQVMMNFFSWALKECNATDAGWQVVADTDGTNVRTSLHRQVVTVGHHYAPHSKRRLRQVVAHEVLVHVRRALRESDKSRMGDEEGVAVLVEQLLSSQFMYRRMLRYLAAAVAWGVDGKPRTFRDTFEIVWRAFMIVGHLGEEHAKQRAFAECTRIFRGGVPEVAGAAYIKDKVYFETNLTLWRELEDNMLNQQEFLDLIDGNKQI